MRANRFNRLTPALSLAAMATLIVFGNLRAPVAAAGGAAGTGMGVAVDGGSMASRSVDGRSATPAALEAMSGVDADSSGPDYGALVPALYAWNPDVRFLYFRQVSKWM